MRRDFACDAQPACFGPANLFERRFRGKMRDVQARALSSASCTSRATQTDSAAAGIRANQDELK